MDLLIEPTSEHWSALLAPPDGEFLGAAQSNWRIRTRQELSLDTARPIIATGHQTLLWHPGILAKYFAMVEYAKANGLAMANLIVDQHADKFGSFDAPVRGFDDAFTTREFVLTTPRKGVPMGLHEPFTPPRPPANWRAAIESVQVGGQAIFDAVYAHRDASSAAMQMAGALSDLMQRWVPPLPSVTSSGLMTTSLARALLEQMAADPWTCANLYNEAVRANPDAGVTELLVRDDYVELPLWRIRPDGTRMRAYDNDVERWLRKRDDDTTSRDREGAESHQSRARQEAAFSPRPEPRENRSLTVAAPTQPTDSLTPANLILLPRALFLTALVRLGVADLFIHGTGGGVYDRAMEQWVQSWLGVTPSSIAVVSATLHLPLLPPLAPGSAGGQHEVSRGDESHQSSPISEQPEPTDPATALHQARKLWHDPATLTSNPSPLAPQPSPSKQEWLDRINALQRRSPERRAAFLTMHRELAALRAEHKSALDAAWHCARTAAHRREAETIATRRDWPFPLYPVGMIDGLKSGIALRFSAAPTSSPHHSAAGQAD